MGAPGAALATSISYTCMSILSLLFFLHVTKYRIFDVFIFDRYEFDIVMKFIYKTFKMGRKTS
jgi:Na+-driven multidrug efflux pump